MLAIYDRPLIDELFEVWEHGPVSPAIYHNLSRFKSRPIRGFDPIVLHAEAKRTLYPQERYIIDEVFALYGEYSGPVMSQWTHARGTPWDQAKKQNRLYITNESIRRYYSRLLRDGNGGKRREA